MPEENNYAEMFVDLIRSYDLNYGKEETIGLLMFHLSLDEEKAIELYTKCVPEDELVNVEFECPMCGLTHYIHGLPRAKVVKAKLKHGYIQDIFPDMPASDREKFITGYCDACQKKIFGTEED